MFLALSLMVLAAAPWLKEWLGTEFAWWVVTAVVASAIAVLVSIAFLRTTFPHQIRGPVVISANAIVGHLRNLARSPVFMLPTLMIAFVSIPNLALVAWGTCLALGIEVPLWTCVLVFPAVFPLSSLPVSIGGWGVREGVVVALFTMNGVPAAQTLVASLSFGAISALITVPGVLGIFPLRPSRRGRSSSDSSF